MDMIDIKNPEWRNFKNIIAICEAEGFKYSDNELMELWTANKKGIEGLKAYIQKTLEKYTSR
jgi:hypothetical protein